MAVGKGQLARKVQIFKSLKVKMAVSKGQLARKVQRFKSSKVQTRSWQKAISSWQKKVLKFKGFRVSEFQVTGFKCSKVQFSVYSWQEK